MSDYENPGRRYKWFRPRQATRGFAATGSPTNHATVALYNTSTAPHVLVVRSVRLISGATIQTNFSNQDGSLGGTAGNTGNVVQGGPAQAGKITTMDSATLFTADFAMQSAAGVEAWWPHDFPVAVILPNHSLVLQVNTTASALNASLLWEAIPIDELDWFY